MVIIEVNVPLCRGNVALPSKGSEQPHANAFVGQPCDVSASNGSRRLQTARLVDVAMSCFAEKSGLFSFQAAFSTRNDASRKKPAQVAPAIFRSCVSVSI